MAQRIKFKPNTLIAYHGGGYDGCIFEWNYAFIDDEGTFHDVFSSGVMGQHSLPDLQSYLSGQPATDVYDFSKVKDRLRFTTRESVVGVLRVIAYFRHMPNPPEFPAMCRRCEKPCSAYDAFASGPHNVGGINIGFYGFVCEDCWTEDD